MILIFKGTFVISHEDHTIGNIIRQQLLKDRKVVNFAGYRKPHPLMNKVELKIQTHNDSRPYDALTNSVAELKNLNVKLKRSFNEQMKKLQMN